MRLRLRDTTALAAGSAVSGLLAYVFFALATRHLGSEDAAAVSVLWTYWSFAAAVLTFPLQHWITRSVAAHGGEGAVRAALPRVALFVLAIALASGLLAALGRDRLFHREDLWFPLLVVWVTLGSGFIGVVRGGLAARHRFFGNAVALVSENGSRCLLAAVLVVAGIQVNVGFGICLALGSMVGLFWPSAFRFDRRTTHGEPESAFTFLTGAAGGQLIGQAILTGGPVVLALSGGTPGQVTALFAGLALFRAPYTVAIGLVSQVTGRLTRLLVSGQYAALRRLRRVLIGVTLLGSGGAAVVGWYVGPPLVQAIFGASVVVPADVSLLLAVGSTVALANLVSTITIMAQHRTHAVARGWTVALAAGAVTFAGLQVGGVTDPLDRTAWAFLVAEAVAFGALLLEEARGLRLTEHRAGSPAAAA